MQVSYALTTPDASRAAMLTNYFIIS